MRLLVTLAACLLAATPAAAESLHLQPLDTARTAGPQKEIPYRFEVTNLEDQPVEVRFEVVDPRGGGIREWVIVAPEPMRLEADGTGVAVAIVSTPYDNGYNKDKATFMLRATPVAPGTDEPVGEPELIELGATVKGWYVPAPSAGLAVAALAGLAVALRRRD